VQSSITIRSRSGLGTVLATLVVTALLLSAVLIDTSVRGWVYATFSSVFGPGKPGRTFTDNLAAQLKAMDRPQALTMYAVLVLAGGLSVTTIGCFLRAYRFRFVPERQVVERQEMWLFTPVWVLIWVVLALPLWKLGKGQAWVWDWAWPTVVMLAGPAVLLALAWVLAPDLAGRAVFVRKVRRRVPLWPAAAVVLALALWLTAWVVAKWTGWWPVIRVTVPKGVAWAALLPPMPLIVLWALVPQVLRVNLFVPGFRKRVPFARVKRMEIQAAGEGGAGGIGGTMLVLTLANDFTWTINRGSPRRLQRLGSVLSRVVGLERRDLMTWA
jgi:hypothetical protein